MHLSIFGASGQTGQFLVQKALQRNHSVTAFVRSPNLFPIRDPNLLVVHGDVLRAREVADAVQGADAVFCVIGGRSPGSRVCSEGTKNIIRAMRHHHVRRLIAVTGMGAGDSRRRFGVVGRLAMRAFLSLEDKDRQEDLIRGSDLEWTIVRPPMLTNEPHTGTYRVGADLKATSMTKLARADLVEFLLTQLTDPTYLHQTPTMVY